MPFVQSTAILRIEYDKSSKLLRVTFRDSGDTYTYRGVPESEYKAFMTAASKGDYFNTRIKDRYPFN